MAGKSSAGKSSAGKSSAGKSSAPKAAAGKTGPRPIPAQAGTGDALHGSPAPAPGIPGRSSGRPACQHAPAGHHRIARQR